MAHSNPTRPVLPGSEARRNDSAPADMQPSPQDPRSAAAIDDIGDDIDLDLDDRDLLDVALDQVGDDGNHRSFADDVRSDSNDDEKHERR